MDLISDTDVRLRAGDAADVDAVLALMDEAVAWLVALGQTGQWGTEPWSRRPQARARFEQLIEAGSLTLAVRDGEPVGAAVLGSAPDYVEPVARSERYLNLLVSSRRHAGQAIGTRLVRLARDCARRQGAELLRVDCWAGSPRLVAWYEAQGFQRAGKFELRGWPGQVLSQELRLAG